MLVALPVFTWLALASLTPAPGCGEPECSGMLEGHHYKVEVLERYDENSIFEFLWCQRIGSSLGF
jgi:hypothetical protein